MNSVLDVMSPEELNEIAGTKIGEWPEYEDDGEEVKVVESGFAFANDIETEWEEAVREKEDVPELFETEIADQEGPPSHEECAQAIIAYINEHGGVANADWKKKGLVPDTYEYEHRKKVREILESKEGITYWKRNNMWWFWYKEEEGLDAAHTRAYGSPP